jgi:hypothetical protein
MEFKTNRKGIDRILRHVLCQHSYGDLNFAVPFFQVQSKGGEWNNKKHIPHGPGYYRLKRLLKVLHGEAAPIRRSAMREEIELRKGRDTGNPNSLPISVEPAENHKNRTKRSEEQQLSDRSTGTETPPPASKP